MWKDFFYFSKSEVRGTYALLSIIGILIVVKICIGLFPRSSTPLPPIKDTPLEPAVLTIELNSADTTALKTLYGIGSVYAKRICKYRDKIGGFSKKDDLLKVYGITQEIYAKIEDKIWVDTTKIVKPKPNKQYQRKPQYGDY